VLALAFFTITAATEHAISPPAADQIPLTRNEIATLFSTLIIDPVTDARHRLRWSTWRRHGQHRARTSHYQRQASQLSLIRSAGTDRSYGTWRAVPPVRHAGTTRSR
jgi:hypothetical protein